MIKTFSPLKMMKRFYIFYALAIIMLFGCRQEQDPVLRGRILFWHDWGSEDTAVLNDLLDGFRALNPEVRVVTVAVPVGSIRQRYEETASLGLGPDLLILSDAEVRSFADANLIRPVPDEATNANNFLSTGLDSLRYQGNLYGLPLSLRPMALYYNTDQVAEPAGTLDVLLQQVRDGQTFALNSQFAASLWGVTAFGGDVFDDEGQVVLNQGGYTNWLNWLKTAQEIPGIILDRNDETLQTLFVAGRAAYYTGDSRALSAIKEQMGDQAVGVASLPSGPNGPAGPLLHVEALLFNRASSDHQNELALALANYLTNAEQNARLMRETNRIPANGLVRVDQQAFPLIAGFAAQARTAVAVPQLPQMETLIAEGEEMLRGILTGLVDVNEAAVQLAQTVNDQYGLETVPVDEVTADCDAAGTLTVWHAWRDAPAAALTQVANDFMAQCPDATVQLRQFEGDELLEQLIEGSVDERGPDLILGSSEWTLRLVNSGKIAPLTGRVEADLLQRYVPVALNTLRLDGQLYGLPMNLNLTALYYNEAAISDPATTLDDLLTEAAAGNKVALPATFNNAFWGIAAYGGRLFDDAYRLTLVESGFVDWLAWLQQAQNVPGMILSRDDAILQALFSSGAVVYYAGSSQRLLRFQSELGAETVRVTVLPAGPGGAAAPQLSTDAFFFNTAVGQVNGELARDFALFATAVDAQTTLVSQAQIVPANVNVDTANFPAIEGFLNQAQSTTVWPQVPQLTAVQQQGDQVYESVLLRGLSPRIVACEFEISVNEANGIALEPAELPEICATENEASSDR